MLLSHFNEKQEQRSFSTSTPILPASDYFKKPSSVFSPDSDSGIGISPGGPFRSIDDGTSQYSSVGICLTPTFSKSPPRPFGSRDIELTSSPLSSKANRFFSRRSIESNFSECIGELSASQGSNSSEARESLSCVRKLDLDAEISYQKVEKPIFSDEKLAQRFEEVLSTHAPSHRDSLIGRKIGAGNVDVLEKLANQNVGHVLSKILSYLDAKDLCRMCQVSIGWRSICETDIVANQRRRRFLKRSNRISEKIGKENLGKRPHAPASRNPSTGGVLQTLLTAQLISEPPPHPPPDRVSTSELFQQAAGSLKNEERLQKCPRCRKPAKVLPVQERGVCQNSECKFDYCVKCFHDFHHSKDCVPIAQKRIKTDAIGAKKSKKNLKRL